MEILLLKSAIEVKLLVGHSDLLKPIKKPISSKGDFGRFSFVGVDAVRARLKT